MATTVSLVIANCANTPIDLTIHGTGMVVANLFLTCDGNNVPYTVVNETSDTINVRPNVFTNGLWCFGFVPYAALLCTRLDCPALDFSGLYFLNNAKAQKHDSYNTSERKIPNPLVRTALIGE